MSICINHNGEILVKAPTRTSDSVIEKFVLSHTDWIAKNMQKVQKRLPLYTPYTALEGELVLVLGRQYCIVYTDGDSHIHAGTLYLHRSANPVQSLVDFYQTLAQELVIERAKRLAHSINIEGVSFKLSSAKTSWGTCNIRTGIRLSWRLVLVDASLIDYVILHELCHLRQPNHSKEFWRLVQAYMPDWALRRRKLKEYGHLPYII